jgi:hypothetical protein
MLRMLAFFALIGSANACPFPAPSAGDRLTAFSQGYDSGGLLGAFGNTDAPVREREANCTLWRQLVACGYDGEGAVVLIMNKKTLMPVIARVLLQCARSKPH